MRAIEFTAKIKDGVIQIPEKYKKLANQIARIIVLTDEENTTQSPQNIDAIQSILTQLRDKKVFSEVTDPISWQRSIRDEWK